MSQYIPPQDLYAKGESVRETELCLPAMMTARGHVELDIT